MMKISLNSKVNGELEAVYERFDADLFRYLLPSGAKLIEFGGSRKGDRVQLRLPLVGEWVSEITEDSSSENMYYFIDEGRKLPFPLKKWHHKHILERDGQTRTRIIDVMNFSTGTIIMDILFYPALYLAFLPRTWQYAKYFKKINGL